MRPLRKHRRWSLVPALLWLLAQWSLESALAAPGGPPPADGAEPFSTIVICTPAGTKTIPGPAEGSDGGTPAPAVKGCEWCQSFGAVAAVPPAEERPLDLSPRGTAAFRSQDTIHRSALAATGFLSRAPPA